MLTMGNRPDDLDRGLRSLLAQRDVELDVVVVGNGWQPTGLPDGVKAHGLPENVGIPAGRNAGVPWSAATCCSSSTTTLAAPCRHPGQLAAQFATDPSWD